MSGESNRTAQRRGVARPVSLRIDDDDRDLIDTAAAVARKSRTDFMVDSSRKTAVETLLDARAFKLTEDQAIQLDELFTKPPSPVDKLRRLMATKAPWE